MRFTPYAQAPGRRALQVTGDLLLCAWIVLWLEAGRAVEAATLQLADPGRRLDAGASDVARSLTDAGSTAARVPLVGDDLQGPFVSAGQAASAMADAGRRQVEVVGDLATLLGLVVTAVPVLVVAVLYVPGRIRFARRAAVVQRLLDAGHAGGEQLDLFALRAMTNQPVARLARVSQDPVAAWRAGDAETVRALARLELRAAGVRLPAAAPATRGA